MREVLKDLRLSIAIVAALVAWLTTNTCLQSIALQLKRIADTQEEAHK